MFNSKGLELVQLIYSLPRTAKKKFLQVWHDPVTGHDVVECTDSIAVLIHVVDKDEVILIREDRVAMRENYNISGAIVGPVAGRFDKNQKLMDLIIAECDEEAGAHPRPDQIELLNHGQSVAKSSGIITEKTFLAYAATNSDQLDLGEKFGLAEEHEDTTRLHIKASALKDILFGDLAAFALIQWFLLNKAGR